MPLNEGQKYEIKINQILEDKGIFPLQLKGNLEGRDSAFKHKGIIYYLELKNKVAPDFGQKALTWNRRDGWVWSTPDDVTEMYDEMKVRDQIPKDFKPNLFTVALKDFKQSHQVRDREGFSKIIDIPDGSKNALHKFYANKQVFYIQMEDRGFYYLQKDLARLKDLANLELAQFNPQLYLRLRVKPRSDKNPMDYAFWAVIRVRARTIPVTNFDIEEKRGKKFPPIKK